MMEKALNKALQKAQTYAEYRKTVAKHVAEGTSTGYTQSEALSNYTMLNDRRMKRLDKTIKLTDDLVDKIIGYDRKVTWLVITESWCGDAAHTMPVINKIASLNDCINFKVVLRDENDELMNQYLTNGSKSVPKLLVIDEASGEVINTWGPRPLKATKMVDDFKKAHGTLTPEFKQELQIWYNKDKGQNTATDIVSLMVLERVGNRT
jgi:thiol-disulfide isomerase/thioredoxin